jgi:hypothetical protein
LAKDYAKPLALLYTTLMLGLDGVCVTSSKDGKRKFVKDTNLEKEKKSAIDPGW